MITAIVILVLLVVALGYTTYNLLRKVEKQEDIIQSQYEYVNKISETVEFIDKRVTEIDTKGSFKADDEVGFFFERLKMLNELLKTYKLNQ